MISKFVLIGCFLVALLLHDALTMATATLAKNSKLAFLAVIVVVIVVLLFLLGGGTLGGLK